MAAAAFEFTYGCQVDIASSWNAQRSKATVVSQTSAIAYIEDEAQTDLSALRVTDQLDKGVETDRPVAPPARLTDGTVWSYAGPHYDDESLASFVDSVFSELTLDLLLNAKSSAFDNYEANWKPKAQNIALAATLPSPLPAEEEVHVTALAWSCSASCLAASYTRVDAASWCPTKGHVAIFAAASLTGAGAAAARDDPSFTTAASSSSFVDTSKPTLVLECDSFVTSLAFHPEVASLLAGGTYTGDVVIWNISEERVKPMTSQSTAVTPREPVLQLQWLQTRELHRFVLCSASSDGRILFWDPAKNKLSEPIAGYEVQNRKRVVVGVQSMSFVSSGAASKVPGVENVMLLGLESGDVFRTKPGKTIGSSTAAASTKIESSTATASGLGVLEVDHFEAHRGPVQSVCCSPFFRNLFLSCASDGCIRLYTTLERAPLLVVEPSFDSRGYLYGAHFSPTRPSVFIAVSRSSHMFIYDLEASKSKPVVTVDCGVDGAAVLSLGWSRAAPNLVATGDARGNIRIWQLSTELCEASDSERAAVRQMELMRKPASPTASPPPQAAAGSSSESEHKVDAFRHVFGFSI